MFSIRSQNATFSSPDYRDPLACFLPSPTILLAITWSRPSQPSSQLNSLEFIPGKGLSPRYIATLLGWRAPLVGGVTGRNTEKEPAIER
jgi:hypothetical protein